jgi:hypothetical protein
MKWVAILAFAPVIALTAIYPGAFQVRQTIAQPDLNAAVDITGYPDLKQAIGQTGPAPRILQISKKWVTGTLAIPRDVELQFLGDGQLVVESGATVSFLGPLGHPTLKQVFAASGRNDGSQGSGSIKFAAGNLADAYSIWWGDNGDGTGDSSTAINAAIGSNARIIWVLDGTHLITHPINLTNLLGGVILQGVGRSYMHSTEIAADTGGVAVDCTGSGNVVIRNLRITTQPRQVTSPSVVGILYGRTAQNQSAGSNTLNDVQVTVASNIHANQGHGSVGIYNDQSEIFRAYDVDARGDTPVVFTRNNIYHITSGLVSTYESARSMGDAAILGGSELYSLGKDRSAIVIQGGTNITLDETYLCAPIANTAASVAAVSLTETYRVTLKLMIEGYGRAIYANGVNESLIVEGTLNSPRSAYIFLDGDHPGDFGGPPGVSNGIVNILPFGRDVSTYPIIETAGAQRGITDTQIHLPRNGSIETPGGPFTGNIIYASSMYPRVTSLAGATSFLVLSSSGIRAGGAPFTAARIASGGGTSLEVDDFGLAPTWGDKAEIRDIHATDQRGRFTVRSAGQGQAFGPRLTIKFKDGPWATAPFAVVARNGGDQPSVAPQWSTTERTLTITFPALPRAGEAYTFEFIMMD